MDSKERIRITGHTDDRSGPAESMKLGLERANKVKAILVSMGVSPTQILASSKGQADPIASNDTEEGRKLNRRTELEIIK